MVVSMLTNLEFRPNDVIGKTHPTLFEFLRTPMKLTADRNEAPPKKKKKLKRKSKEKKQVQSPQRKHLLDKVDKVRSHITLHHP